MIQFGAVHVYHTASVICSNTVDCVPAFAFRVILGFSRYSNVLKQQLFLQNADYRGHQRPSMCIAGMEIFGLLV